MIILGTRLENRTPYFEVKEQVQVMDSDCKAYDIWSIYTTVMDASQMIIMMAVMYGLNRGKGISAHRDH
jgi:hypothetical protein